MNENRFTGKADSYSMHRPGYPNEIIPLLQKECGLTDKSIIADIGAGTGIFTALISAFCKTVYAVEPNGDMRSQINKKDNINIITATAENTTLANNSIDIITAAQAFHWFDKKLIKPEFKRILKSDGYAVLVWNNRNRNSPFEKEYEALCDSYRDDYLKENDKRAIEADKIQFYHNGIYKKFYFDNAQCLDFAQIKGRTLSSSYIPKENTAEFIKIENELKRLFELYSVNNKITLTMQTEIFIGKI